MSQAQQLAFMQQGMIGRLAVKNRLVRAPTSETMATEDGLATKELRAHYRALAAGGAGLLITGHIFVEPGGQYEPRQLGLHSDACIPGLLGLTQEVHREGSLIFAELAHAGSQSVLSHVQPISPSVIPNAMHARKPAAMSEADIKRVVSAFGAAAGRAMAAGFDGIHIHGGNGYLISQFSSPASNRREDAWGGDASRRGQFIRSVYEVIRRNVGPDVPITARFGLRDAMKNGLALDEGVERVAELVRLGLDGVEPTYNLMETYRQNIRPYAGNTLLHGLADGAVQQILFPKVEEAYYRPFARAVKARTKVQVFLVGGLRTTAVMDDVVRSGDADFLSLCRPFIREPDLPKQIQAGRRGIVDCVSCNLCFQHEGLDPLRCWRVPKTALLSHAIKYYFMRR
jgi:2,4-dienoyl-CoA reductase-like NADH-dependent reductase (Old Yellow Enzyme family)